MSVHGGVVRASGWSAIGVPDLWSPGHIELKCGAVPREDRDADDATWRGGAHAGLRFGRDGSKREQRQSASLSGAAARRAATIQPRKTVIAMAARVRALGDSAVPAS